MDPVNLNNADPIVPDASNVNQPPSVDVSQGVPLQAQPNTVQPLAQPNVDDFNKAADASVYPNQPATPPVDGEQDYKAINERLMQQNARNAKLMAAVGMDPLSDMGEQLEAGIISPEQIKNHFMPQQQMQPQNQVQMSQTPVDLAMAEQAEAEKAYNDEAAQGGISIETNNRLRMADRAVSEARINGVRQEFTDERNLNQANANVNAVLGVAHNDANYAGLDDTLKGSVDLATIAMTGVIADQQARQMGIDPQNMSPQQAAYFAQQANGQLGALATHFMQLGANQVRAGQNPISNVNNNPNQFVPNPVGAHGAPASQAPNPYANATLDNHRAMAAKYMAGGRQV